MRRIRRGQRVQIFETFRQRKHGSLIEVSLTISPVRNAQGKVIGASKIARDITERKRSEAQIVDLAQEAEHRTKNILATVQATVHLSQSDTADGLKHAAIEGRIQALANVHQLFVDSRWTGAELQSLVSQELSPYCQNGETRVRIDGPVLLLERQTAQTIAITLHELATGDETAGDVIEAADAQGKSSSRMVVRARRQSCASLDRSRWSARLSPDAPWLWHPRHGEHDSANECRYALRLAHRRLACKIAIPTTIGRLALMRHTAKPRAVGVHGALQRQISALRGRVEAEPVGQRAFGGRLSV